SEKQQGQHDGKNRIGVAHRIEREIAAFGDGTVPAQPRGGGVSEFMQAQTDDPADKHKREDADGAAAAGREFSAQDGEYADQRPENGAHALVLRGSRRARGMRGIAHRSSAKICTTGVPPSSRRARYMPGVLKRQTPWPRPSITMTPPSPWIESSS